MSDSFRQSPLTTLAVEVLTNIFGSLDLLSLLRCSSVCKLLHDVVEGTPRIQYKMELEIAGLTDRPTVEMPVTERISTLASHQRFLKSLTREIPVWRTHFDEAVAYYGDLAVLCLPLRQDGVRSKSLKICRIPPTYSDTGASRHWWNVKSELSFTGIWMDPGQDLMALTQFRPDMTGSPLLSLQVLSISSGERLSNSDFWFRISKSPLRWKMEQCFICDDMLAMVICQSPPVNSSLRRVLICGWKDGRVRTSLNSPQFTSDFRFLSRSTFIVGYRPADSLENIGIRLFSFNPDISPDTRNPEPRLIAIFHFPTLAIQSIKLHIQTFGMEQRGCHNSPKSQRIFETSRDREVLAISIHSDDPKSPVFFFIDPSVFRSFTPTQEEAASIPWSTWGPKNTRLLGIGCTYSMFCRCYGTRAYLPGFILDFNALDVRRDDNLRRLGKAQSVPEGHLYPGRESAPDGKGNLFKDRYVRTMLPFRLIQYSRDRQIWPGEDWIMSQRTRS